MTNKDCRILKKIIEYCEQTECILAQINRSYEIFISDFLYRNALRMCILQIGELAGQLSEETKLENATIPWRVIKDMRNIFVHAYGDINPAMTFNTLLHDIPPLKVQSMDILSRI